MRHLDRQQRLAAFILGAFFFCTLVLFIEYGIARRWLGPVKYGVTYSTKYAWQLGYDTHVAFIAVLDDLGVRRIRLPVYWTDIEKKPGEYDWNEVDWLLNEAGKRHAEVTLVLGQRVPRYPECHVPKFVLTQSIQDQNAALIRYFTAAIAHFDSSSAVARFQIENEPLFAYFGECAPPDPGLLKTEFDIARTVTKKTLMTTVSGEFQSWLREAQLADVLGVSLYRGAYIGKLGFFSYPIPSWYYLLRRETIAPYVHDVIISELQVEPWFIHPIPEITVEDQVKLMPISRIRDTVRYAEETGFSEIDLWGVEWWYYLKTKYGVNDYWEYGKTLFAK